MNLFEMEELKSEFGLDNALISKLTGVSPQKIQVLFEGDVYALEINEILSIGRLFHDLQDDHGCIAESSVYQSEKGQEDYTVDDYFQFIEERRVELIDGVIYDLSSPTYIHQRIIVEISRQITNYIKKYKGKCEVLFSPLDVQLDQDNRTMVQPDLFIVCEDDKFDDHGLCGAPDWVMEVLSPSTKQKDLTTKLKKYRNAGVREYWIVDPKNRTVAVYEFEKGPFPTNYTFEDKIPVGIYDGKLMIDMTQIKKSE